MSMERWAIPRWRATPTCANKNGELLEVFVDKNPELGDSGRN